MAENLRSEDFWRVNCMIGGYDSTEKKGYLSMIDHYATNVPSQVFTQFIKINILIRILCSLAFLAVSHIQSWMLDTLQVGHFSTFHTNN
jgi:hypothetical protein